MDAQILEVVSSGGLILVGAYLVWYVTKRHRELEDYINRKLIQVIENNTKAMQQLINVINELRQEIKEEFKRVYERIEKG